MTQKPKVLFCLDEPLLEAFISEAQRAIVYAGPSLSTAVAEAIVKKKQEKPRLSINVILDPSVDPLRLGFGEIGGLKLLQNSGIDIRCQPGLRIGVVLVDDRAWMFTPTPEIILEKPEPGTINAVNVSTGFAKWLMQAIAPRQGYVDIVEDILDEYRSRIPSKEKKDKEAEVKDQDPGDSVFDDEIIESEEELELELENNESISVRDVHAEIGEEVLSSEQLSKIQQEVDSNPPKQFDHAREILVYNGYFQFVEMKFSGARLSSRSIRLPDHLLDLVDDPVTSIEVRTTCKLFENIDSECPEIKEFDRTVNDVRRHFTHPLGNELGSVMLATDREKFNTRLEELNKELGVLTKATKLLVGEAIRERLSRLVEIFVPLLIGHPNTSIKRRFEGLENPEGLARKLVTDALTRAFPDADSIMEKMEIRCRFKDVTWEMLNDEKFVAAVKDCFPDAKFAKLYQERQTVGEREPTTKREITSEDWPDELDTVPDG